MKKILLAALAFTTSVTFAQNVTFQVDMNEYSGSFVTPELNGDFNGWCGNCAPMTDANMDGIWEITVDLSGVTSIEYKFSFDNWGGQENLAPGMTCTVTNSGFTNRYLDITGDVVLDPVCWESCETCAQTAPTYDVTFQVDMNEHSGGFTTPEVNGIFNGWCGNCTPMTDDNGDGIWEATVAIQADTMEYKFSFDNWTGQESLTEGMPCTVTKDGFTNRVVYLSADTVLGPVCWDACEACNATAVEEVRVANDFKIAPNPSNGNVVVSFTTEMNQANLMITDLSGKEVFRTIYSGGEVRSELQLPDLIDGVYIVTLEAEGAAQHLQLIIQ